MCWASWKTICGERYALAIWEYLVSNIMEWKEGVGATKVERRTGRGPMTTPPPSNIGQLEKYFVNTAY